MFYICNYKFKPLIDEISKQPNDLNGNCPEEIVPERIQKKVGKQKTEKGNLITTHLISVPVVVVVAAVVVVSVQAVVVVPACAVVVVLVPTMVVVAAVVVVFLCQQWL